MMHAARARESLVWVRFDRRLRSRAFCSGDPTRDRNSSPQRIGRDTKHSARDLQAGAHRQSLRSKGVTPVSGI